MNDHIWLGASTDITVRWRKVYGYIPASEQAIYKKKWAEWKALFAKAADDLTPEKKESTKSQVYQMKRTK